MEYRKGTVVFTNWIIEKELGEGATGRVFEIQKTDYGITTRSALKVIRVPHSDSDIRAAFAEGMSEESVSSYFQGFVDEIVKEIVIMSNLKSHPNIVSYEDHQVTMHEDSLGWDILIRMELLTPLYNYQMKQPLDEADVLRMGIELTDALDFCQKKGLIHRDIKPENIFVSETGQFKLGDFGVARTVEKTTGGLSRKGTEKYMAPEVYLGKPYGATVDIYSLGLVLYSFLNHGRLPFYPLDKNQITFADRETALGKRMQGETIPAPADASADIAEVILKACAFLPEERYQSAAEMREDLEAIAYERKSRHGEPSFMTYSRDTVQEEKTVGMETEICPEAEEKTTGMEEILSEPEEKTVGMIDEPAAEPEEKTVGTEAIITEEEEKTTAAEEDAAEQEEKEEEKQETSLDDQKLNATKILVNLNTRTIKIQNRLKVLSVITAVLAIFVLWLFRPMDTEIDRGLLKDMPLGNNVAEIRQWLDQNGYDYEIENGGVYKGTVWEQTTIIVNTGWNSFWNINIHCYDSAAMTSSISFEQKHPFVGYAKTVIDHLNKEYAQEFGQVSYTEWSTEYSDGENVYEVNNQSFGFPSFVSVSRETLREADADTIDIGAQIFAECPLDSVDSAKKWLEENGYYYEENQGFTEIILANSTISLESYSGGAHLTTIASFKNAEEVYETTKQKIQQITGIEGEKRYDMGYEAEWEWKLEDRTVRISLDEVTHEIYLTLY